MADKDARVRVTKQLLHEALLKLLAHKNINSVTIKELCETAGVNRGTFYLHYTTPNDVLMEIEQDFIGRHMQYLMPYFATAVQGDRREHSQLADLFAGMLADREICRVIMGENGSPRFTERLYKAMLPDVLEQWQKEFPHYSRENLEYVFSFVFAGSTRLILDWFADDRGLSSRELANRLDRLGHYCHLAIKEFN